MIPKRVLMIAQTHSEYDPRVIRFINTLKEIEIETDFICLRYDDQNKYDEKEGVRTFRIMKGFNQNSIFSYVFFSVLFLIKATLKTFELTRKNNYSVIHINNMPDYIVFAGSYPKYKKIPVLLDIHDLTVELFREKWSEKKFKFFKPVLEFVEKISCKFADHVITVTDECMDRLRLRGVSPDKLSLIMNSPDEKKFTFDNFRFADKEEKRFRVIYHGTVAERFGLHYVIKAMSHVKKINPEIEFHIYGAGEDEYSTGLKGLAENLNVTDKIIFHCMIPHSEINDLLKSFDLGIVPYEQSEYMNLAFPTKAGEYALTGLPFIISNLDSVKRIFQPESVLYIDINSKDSANIADAIIVMINEKDKRQRMSGNAYDDIKKISWDLMKKRYLELLTEITDAGELVTQQNSFRKIGY